MSKKIIIHKAFGEEEVSINIESLASGVNLEVYEQEGVDLARILWDVLPSTTIDTLMAKLQEFNEQLMANENPS